MEITWLPTVPLLWPWTKGRGWTKRLLKVLYNAFLCFLECALWPLPARCLEPGNVTEGLSSWCFLNSSFKI